MSRIIGEQLHLVKGVIERLHIRQSNDSPENTFTEQYGFLKFDEDEPDKTTRFSQFIRLALTTDSATVVQFMREAWKLPTPDLIISVTGGAKHFELPARLRKAFQLGLVSVAATTNAWIITQGTNAGVVKEVGEALNKYRYTNQKDGLDIPCIGIASWGYTAGKDQLDRSLSVINANSRDSNGNIVHKRTKYDIGIDALQPTGEAAFGMRTYVVKENKEKKRCDLEPNHTHFFLFDDGTSVPSNVLPLRAAIERDSRHVHTSAEVIETPTPIVLVLVEGGRSAVASFCAALNSETPVVVVNNSGRAADLIAGLYAIFSKDSVDDSTDDELNEKRPPSRTNFARTTFRLGEINTIFSKFLPNNSWVNDVRNDLCLALNKYKQLVTIFDFDSKRHDGKLEGAILDAVFNAANHSNENNEQHRSAAELRLALAWNNLDYARRAIFTDATISNWTKDDLRLGLVDAISRGYIAFIELFIEYGVTLEKITVGDLELLYSKAFRDEVLPFKKYRQAPTREDFFGDYLRTGLELSMDKNSVLGENAPRELYFWAIFLNRFEFAVYLCSKTWNQTVALLYGARFYNKAAKISLDSENKHEFETNAEKFDKHAAAIIDKCFDVDRDFAVELLNRKAVGFYEIYPLKLALKADCRAFLASRCVQRHLDNEWFGNINYKRQNINFRIFFCSLFFPLLPIFCFTLPYIRRHQSFNPNANYHTKHLSSTTNYNAANTNNIQWSEKIGFFYRAPIVTFYYNLLFFFVFLGLFSYVLLVDYFPINIYDGYRSGVLNLPIPMAEIWLHVFIWGIIIEELRQVVLMNSYAEYFDEISNMIDLSAIILYLIGFITRFIVIEEFFMISKIALGVDLILWYVRILHLFAAYEKLGPKLIMIFNTMKDLLFFVCFILIFLFGFSITSWALIITPSQVHWIYNPKGDLVNITISEDQTDAWNWRLIRDVTNYGIWKVFGQVDLIETTNSYTAVAFILAILFVAISNVLLLNVLVALFNVTITNVQEQSHNIWRYQRYLIVNEFRHKSLLPPPFNTLYCFINALVRFIKQRRTKYRNHRIVSTVARFTIDVQDPSDHNFKITESMQRESAIAEDYWRALKLMEEKAYWERQQNYAMNSEAGYSPNKSEIGIQSTVPYRTSVTEIEKPRFRSNYT